MPAVTLHNCQHCHDTRTIYTRFDATVTVETGIMGRVEQCPYCRMNHEHSKHIDEPVQSLSPIAKAFRTIFPTSKTR